MQQLTRETNSMYFIKATNTGHSYAPNNMH